MAPVGFGGEFSFTVVTMVVTVTVEGERVA